MFAKLREILADPHMQDYERWEELRELFDAWEDEEERTQGIAYADAHLAITEHERELRSLDTSAPIWPLVRKVSTHPEALAKLDDDADFSQIKILYMNHYNCADGDTSYMRRFSGVRELRFAGCDALQPLDALCDLAHLEHLELMGGSYREAHPFPEVCLSLPQLKNLRKLTLRGYFGGTHRGWLEEMTALETLVLGVGVSVDELKILSSLKNLRTLRLETFEGAVDLQELVKYLPRGLTSLSLRNCEGLGSLAGIEEMTKLRSLELSYNDHLRTLEGLAALEELEQLKIWRATALRDASALQDLPSLRCVELNGAGRLGSVDFLTGLQSLETLDLTGCRGVKDLSPLGALSGLRTLSFSARHATDMGALAPLVGLESLSADSCTKVQHLDDLSGLVGLQSLALDDCKVLESIEGLRPLQALQTLALQGCKSLESIEVLGELKAIRKLSLYYSRSVKDVTPLCSLPHLKDLDLTGCSGIKKGLRSRHFNEKRITAWRAKVMPKSALPRKSEAAPIRDSSLLPGVPDQVPVDEEAFALADYRAPTKIKEAEALAAFGNKALPLLVRVEKQKVGAAAAAIRALGSIGTPEAYEVLLTYKDEKRKGPTRELIRALGRFPDPMEASEVLLGHRTPKKLDASSLGLEDIGCLSPLTSLEELNLAHNARLSDLSPITSLQSLRKLDLACCSMLADLSPLAALDALEDLRLYWMEVADLSPLAALSNLASLQLHGLGNLRDLTPLAGLPLQTLRIGQTRVENIAPLGSLELLEDLSLEWYEETASLECLAGLPKLRSLRLDFGPRLRSIESLGLLHQIESLHLFASLHQYTSPTEMDIVSALARLTSLRFLDVSFLGAFVDATSLSSLTKLETLVAFGTKQLDPATIPALPALRRLTITESFHVRDLEFLRTFPALEEVTIARCMALTDVSALDDLPQLRLVKVSGCPEIEDILREV